MLALGAVIHYSEYKLAHGKLGLLRFPLISQEGAASAARHRHHPGLSVDLEEGGRLARTKSGLACHPFEPSDLIWSSKYA